MHNNNSIKNIIFDLGGVIINTSMDSSINLLRSKGFNHLERLEGDDFKHIVREFECGNLSFEDFHKHIEALANLNIDIATFTDCWNSILLDIPRSRLATLEQVKKNYNIFLLSNTNETHYRCFLKQFQELTGNRSFDDLFVKAYFSHEIHLAKPDKKIFEFVLDAQNLNPYETMFIDDNADNIAAAQSLGISCRWINNIDINNLFYNGLLK